MARKSNPIVTITNAVAQMLGHGCALTPEEAAVLPSLRSLQAAWVAAGIARNDALPEDQKWASGMEGWLEETTSPGPRVREIILGHVTQSGRLEIEAREARGEWTSASLVLKFWAGPAQEGGEGRLVAQLEFGGGEWYPRFVDPTLLEGRPDRVSLLYDLDRHLGGQIKAELEHCSSRPAGSAGQKAGSLLLLAFEEIERAVEEARLEHERHIAAVHAAAAVTRRERELHPEQYLESCNE